MIEAPAQPDVTLSRSVSVCSRPLSANSPQPEQWRAAAKQPVQAHPRTITSTTVTTPTPAQPDYLGHYHCNNRVYNIHQGRWTSTDPSSSPWTNVLSYTHGNHLKYTDPTGLDDEEIIDEDGDGFDDRFRAIKCKTGFTAEAASGQEPCDCPVKLCQADTFGALGKAAGLKHCYIKLQCSDYLIFELDKSETGEKKSQVHRRKVIEMDAKDDKCVCISGTIWGTPINTDLLYGILMSMALRKEQYDYDVFSRNCCHWAVEILRRIGANLSGINRCGFSDNQGFNKDFTCPEDRPQVNDDDEFPVRPRHN